MPPREAQYACCVYASEGYYYRLKRYGETLWIIYTAPGRVKAIPWWMKQLLIELKHYDECMTFMPVTPEPIRAQYLKGEIHAQPGTN